MNGSTRSLSGALLNLLEATESAPIALSTRVYRAIRSAIHDSTLRAGDRLPSTRALAADLAISRATAETAYAQLEAEGYLTRHVGDGSYVNAAVPQRTARKTTAMSEAMPANALSRRGRQIASLGSCIDPRQVRAFSAGLPALGAFPREAWQRLLARHAKNFGTHWQMYTDPQGEPQLRDAIAQYLSLSRGVDCDAGQVIVLTSSQQALVLIAMLTLDTGDAVWMEEPGYRGAQTAFAAQGACVVPVPVDADGMRVGEGLKLAPQARLAYATPSHQYPLGMAMSLERRMQLLEWARRERAWIVEDDYDSEFHYDSRPIAAIHGLDRHGRVLYVGTFSKVMYPGLRLAYVVVPKPLVGAFVAARSHLDSHSPALMQLVLADFMENGQFTAHVRRMRELYRARRDIFLEEAAHHLADRLHPQAAAGGLQIACMLRDVRASDKRIAARAEAAGFDLPTLSRLYFGDDKRNGFVMGFSALQPAAIREGVKKLAALW